MQKEELKSKILEVMNSYPVGSVATIRDGKPWVRYMAMQPQEDMILYTASFASSRKIAQIKENNNVHIAFGADPKNWVLPYVNVEGAAEILTDPETKERCWKATFAQFFKGPDDPNYVVIKITPGVIEYMGPGAHEPEMYNM